MYSTPLCVVFSKGYVMYFNARRENVTFDVINLIQPGFVVQHKPKVFCLIYYIIISNFAQVPYFWPYFMANLYKRAVKRQCRRSLGRHFVIFGILQMKFWKITFIYQWAESIHISKILRFLSFLVFVQKMFAENIDMNLWSRF